MTNTQVFNPIGGDKGRGDFNYSSSGTTASDIFLTGITTGGAAGELTVTSITAGVGFTITSSSNTDTRKVAWMILEPSISTLGLMIATGPMFGLTYAS